MTVSPASSDTDKVILREDLKKSKDDPLSLLCSECGIDDYRKALSETVGFDVFTYGDGIPCGFVFTLSVGEECDILGIGVDPGMRRKGIGSILLSGTIRLLKNTGVTKMNLEVRDKNLPAIALYEKLGFGTVRTIKNYYGAGNDALFMTAEL